MIARKFTVKRSYTVVKGFGEKGKLLRRQFLDELTELRDISEFVNALRTTVYADYVSAVQPPYDPVKLGNALMRAVIELHYQLGSLVRSPSVLDATYIRYVGRNLKTVLRGLAVNLGYDRLVELIDLRAEELIGMRDVVIKALSSASLSEAVDSLSRTIFGKVVASAYQLYEKVRDPTVFDVEIDRFVVGEVASSVEHASRTERGPLTEIVHPIVDGFVVTGILRAKLWDLPISEIQRLVEDIDTRLPAPKVRSLIDARSFDEAVNVLSTDRYLRRPVSVGGSPEEIIKSLESFYRTLLVEKAERAFARPRASQAIALASVMLKEREVANLTTIATGLAEKLPPHVIRTKLV